MQKEIRAFARGQMDLWVIAPDNTGNEVSNLIEMGCDIVSADANHVHAKFLKGTLPEGQAKNDLLKKMLDDGWVFHQQERTDNVCHQEDVEEGVTG